LASAPGEAKILALRLRPEGGGQGLNQGQCYKAEAKIMVLRPDKAKMLASRPKPVCLKA